MVRKAVLLVVVLLVFKIPSYAQNMPEWVTKPTFKKGTDYYFVGMGRDVEIAKAREKAMDDVKTKIIESIFVEIVSEAQKTTEISQSKEGIQVVEGFKSDITTKGKARVFVPVPEEEASFQKDGIYTVYVLIKYPAKKLEEERKRIEDMFKEMVKSVDKFLEQGDSFAKEGKIVNAVVAYSLAAKNALAVEERQMKYPEIIKTIENLLSRLSIQVLEGEKKQVVVGGNGTIKFQVFYNLEGQKIPVKDANVKFRVVNGKADISLKGTTDEYGVVVCEVNSISRFENKKLTIRATLDLDFSDLAAINQDTRRDASRLIGKANMVFSEVNWYMSATKSSKAVILAFREDERFIFDSKLSSSLATALSKKGYIPSKVSGIGNLSSVSFDSVKRSVPKDNLIVLVTYSFQGEQEVEFQGEKIKRSKIGGSIEVYDPDGNLINSTDFSFVSSSKEKALQNLSDNISKKLVELEF